MIRQVSATSEEKISLLTFKQTVCVESTNNCPARRIRSSERRLASNAQLVRDRITIHQKREIREEDSECVVKVEAYQTQQL